MIVESKMITNQMLGSILSLVTTRLQRYNPMKNKTKQESPRSLSYTTSQTQRIKHNIKKKSVQRTSTVHTLYSNFIKYKIQTTSQIQLIQLSFIQCLQHTMNAAQGVHTHTGSYHGKAARKRCVLR